MLDGTHPPAYDDREDGARHLFRAPTGFEMEVDFYNVNAGEEFEHDSKRYRKLDDRRAMLIDRSTSDRRVIHLMPESRVQTVKRGT
ncbi:hypothetical protein GCM10023156_41000 [Novipirellula rosea]|uniref:Uncharacterized protein n=2 Tax=Novipirellula rosea TaxID=1031540 RepID=A0ABP8N6R4_9BACT